MKFKYSLFSAITAIVFFSLSATYGQNCLGFIWQINSGDSAQWQSAGFVPRNWSQVNIGISLERQGYRCYSGYYSLWNQVVIPAKYKHSTDGNLQLRFKFEAEKADVFFNGTAIGSSKQPGSEESFDLPHSLVRWGKPNQILIRIRNSFYTGGSCVTYIYIVPGTSKKDVILDAAFTNEQHVYSDPSDIRFSASIGINDGQGFEGVQKAIVISDFHDTVFVNRSAVRVSSGKKKATSYALGRLVPGLYQVQLSFSSGGIESQKICWFAVAPEKITATPVNQQEVWDFWNNAKKELTTIDPQFKLIKVDSLCTEKSNVYIVEMKSLENITVRGWYIVPAKAGVYPAVLHFQGYSVSMQPQWFMNDTDIIHLALDIRGHGLSTDVINPGFDCPGYVGYNLGTPGKYIYRGAFMDCCRAMDFLLSRNEVDTGRIAVAGHSQGGGLSLATAALYSGKIKCCITGSPFLTNFPDHVRIRSVYMDEMQYYMQHNNISCEQVYKTMNLVDNINLVQLIQCPVLMGIGLFDDDCPPHIDFATYNNIKAPKECYILPNRGHILGSDWYKYSGNWLRKKFQLK